jgi:hypothetical protein
MLKLVNWYNEELNKFYNTDKNNNGYIYGIYAYDEYGEEILDVQWFKTIEQRKIYLKQITKQSY